VKITAKTLNARGWNQAGNGDWGNATGEQVVRNERNTWTHIDKSGNKTQYPTLQDAFKSVFAEPTVEKIVPPSRPSTKTTEGKAGKPARPKKEKAVEAKTEPAVISPAVESITAETAKPVTAKAIPSEVKQVLDTLDSPKGKTPRVRKLVNGEHPNIGPKAIFINDNIEQIIAEAEATGKVTKICP
jgi:hypothetical protein